ncbi:1,6-anhydro-N-acetylmuramyl-L-alanine amidase AmpD [Aromatoleum buckelii]|uniref:1,6-anhydro-N-acetylmuramyl-L-alanine amidase AmpD n=1 Tax=Aromatoleum buckelii TaxID=200254 RepID=UPI001B7D0B2A|nr:1,6-anhydro-N-acetylmuramyl-L-alanine amidase AmpD [Aromatoleum buckelii]MCK0510564.1 1,6-anhydro-N-acetylmuramyl-L-alanine amidase AmpD [Aromatoleum buckelii]
MTSSTEAGRPEVPDERGAREALPVFADGWLADAERCESPNYDARPAGCEVRLVVVHAISLPPDEFGGPGVSQLFTNALDPAAHPYYATIRDLRVSAHFFIARDGRLMQFVSADRRAWHAGASNWRGRERCNDFSLGIELEGCDTLPFETAQYERLAALVRTLCAHYPIEDVVGHSDIAPGRKTDPGPFFDWERLGALLAGPGAVAVRGTQPPRPAAGAEAG